jgi:hypothetical protein
MNINTLTGALIAALILFGSSVVTLFTSNPDLTFADLTTATWVSLVGGAAVAFFKDYQALTVRRTVNKISGTGDGGI